MDLKLSFAQIFAKKPTVFRLSSPRQLNNSHDTLPDKYMSRWAVGKGGEIRDTETLNLSRNIVLLQVSVGVSRFSPCVINLSSNKNICCGLKKIVAKNRARVYFVQQILALLLVFHQTHNLALNKFARALANQPIRALHFLDLLQMFLLRIKLIIRKRKQTAVTNITVRFRMVYLT